MGAQKRQHEFKEGPSPWLFPSLGMPFLGILKVDPLTSFNSLSKCHLLKGAYVTTPFKQQLHPTLPKPIPFFSLTEALIFNDSKVIYNKTYLKCPIFYPFVLFNCVSLASFIRMKAP